MLVLTCVAVLCVAGRSPGGPGITLLASGQPKPHCEPNTTNTRATAIQWPLRNWRGGSRTQSTGESSRRLNPCKVVAHGHFTTNHSNSDKVPGATAYHLSGENKSGQHAMMTCTRVGAPPPRQVIHCCRVYGQSWRAQQRVHNHPRHAARTNTNRSAATTNHIKACCGGGGGRGASLMAFPEASWLRWSNLRCRNEA